MASINDVARLAGVSTATVSRAISAPHLVTQQTRLKVTAAISQSGYIGNAIARSLRVNRANAVLVLVPDIANAFFTAVIQGIEQTAHRIGYRIILSETQGKSATSYVKLAAQKQVDGIIFLGPNRSLSSDFATVRSPVVMTCEHRDDCSMPIVRINHELAAEELCTYLINQGHQRIGYINGPIESHASRCRHQGYKNALLKAGIKYDVTLIAIGDYSFQSGIKAMQSLLVSRSRPSAVFAASDLMAMGAIQAAKLAGLHVPTQLSVAGFDDIDFSQICDPPLTTVRQPRFEIGQRAMDAMYAILQGEEPEANEIVIPHQIIVRESTQHFSPN